ncbi:GNAT family N-acetyltransferase [Bradyrhizobium sp. CCBAU 51753]|uniref:GNAT family N-acetyltransferase n=1 Tax=Bradyrhizobium sp. CCBAU 51753 TaxID=1325100 RepID=UPI00188A1958|nr:GNAT family N-acetyltransferase [Bradyrhizobium sp. CCBAU 51753]QOZ28152.1 hypothetical protein XH93_34490 [Bradyrhizobium sp. CCBAU 51753]
MRFLKNVRGEAAGEAMPPLDIVVTRQDVTDEASFRGSGVLELYEALFPLSERDSSDDIVRWVLSEDLGERRQFALGDRQLSYCLDSRCFVLRAAERAIGLGFFTCDHTSHLIFCNYVGVAPAWRGGGLARAFYREMVDMLDELFPRNIGVVLEVEPFDRGQLETVIGDLEQTGRRQLDAHEAATIRKFLRVCWYHKLGYRFFCDAATARPLQCRSPCLDPALPPTEWVGAEEDYWLMWHARERAAPAPSSAGELWRQAVEAIYVEILAKSLVDEDPQRRRGYWDYATALVAETVQRTAVAEVTLARYLGPDDSPLLSRWRRLAIDLPI